MSEKPPIWNHFAACASNVVAFSINTIGLLIPGGAESVNIAFMAINGSIATWYWFWLIPARKAKREDWRKLSYERWLEKRIPELEPSTDWQEIERAVAALLEQGKEPTVERAETWLRREHEEKQYRERVKEIERCPHTHTSVYDSKMGNKTICDACGLLLDERINPFKRWPLAEENFTVDQHEHSIMLDRSSDDALRREARRRGY